MLNQLESERLVGVREGESVKMIDAKEHPERDEYLYERHRQHGKHTHAQLVHLALLSAIRRTVSLSVTP